MSDMPTDPLDVLRSYATPPSEYVSKLPKGKEDKEKRRSCAICGGYHDPGMFHLDYVGHADVTRILLEADPRWNWEPLASTPEGLPLFERDRNGNAVGLWIKLTVGGMTRLGYGSCEASKAEAEKELIGDALRNAAMRFGVALDLWSKSDAGDGGGRDTAPDRRTPDPATRAQLDELLAELETVIVEADAMGLDGDPAKAREYAKQSPAHARKAIQSVRDKMREALADDEGSGTQAGAPAAGTEPGERDASPSPAADDGTSDNNPSSGEGAAAPSPETTADPATCDHAGSIDRIGIARTRCRACGATFGAHGPNGQGVSDESAPAVAEPAETDAGWREVCEDLGVPPVAVVAALVKEWPKNDQAARPNNLKDVDRLTAKPEYRDLVRATIEDIAAERASV